MKSHTTRRFRDLPSEIQEQTRRAYARFRENPSHPGLRFKKIQDRGNVHAARITRDYRALGTVEGDDVVGRDQIREFFVNFLGSRPQLAPSVQAPALLSGNLALTSSRLDNGEITAEIARRQPDGSWLWAVDQFALWKEA